jgi:hypothetical protein
MADASVALLSDDGRWQKASDLAAQDARERFSEAAIVRQYEEFYGYAMELTARRTAKRVSVETPVQST